MNGTLWCHPGSLKEIRAAIGTGTADGRVPSPVSGGIEICTSESVPRYTRRWVPPSGRFWTCEQSDRAWCEPLGLGHWEDTTDPAIYLIRDNPVFNYLQHTKRMLILSS